MSVLIKGMKMPQSREECQFCFEPYNSEPFCNLFPGEFCLFGTACPLVPVPPHGRLIDADALMANAEYKGKHDILTAYDVVAAPTIIEAEGGE